MNVLQLISPSGFYGAERWIVALLNNLEPEHVRTTVLATSEDPASQIELFSHLPPNVDSVRVELKGRFDLLAARQISRLIDERDIDIVHTHGYKSDILGAIAANASGIKAITTPHGFNPHVGAKLKLFVRIGAISYRFFDRIVPLSPKLVEEVLDLGAPRHKITCILNGLDFTELDNVEPKRLSSDPLVHMGYVGQLIGRKGVEDLLEAFNYLWNENKNLKLSIIGDGSERKILESRAKQLASASAIEFKGFRSDRLEVMRTFDLFVMCSKHEGIPRSMMEAMALGVPVVAYDIPGVDQLIDREGLTGRLADPNVPHSLEVACRSMLEHPMRAQQVAACARVKVIEEFSAARMASEYTELYRELMES